MWQVTRDLTKRPKLTTITFLLRNTYHGTIAQTSCIKLQNMAD